jgi:hypothetical protein
MVRKERLELSRLTTLVPKTSASTNSATLAIYLGKKLNTLPKSVKRVLYLKFAYFDKLKPDKNLVETQNYAHYPHITSTQT